MLALTGASLHAAGGVSIAMKTPSFTLSLFPGLLLTILLLFAPAPTVAPANPALALAEGRAAFEAGDYETAVMKLGQYVEAHPDQPRARALLERARLELQRDPGLTYRRKVAAIRIARIDVQDVTMQEFIDYVQAVITAAHKEAGADEDAFVPNFLLRGDGVNEKRFTMQLRNIPLDEALRMAGEMAGVRFRYDPHAVIGIPATGE